MKPARWTWVGLLLTAACAHQQAPLATAETPLAFVQGVYARYDPTKPDAPWLGPGCRLTFSDRLCTLIDRDRREAGDEVPRLDGDPLYDAQDTDIKNLKIAAEGDGVVVTFDNLGTAGNLLLSVVKEAGGWRIDEIQYRHQQPPTTLSGILQGPR